MDEKDVDLHMVQEKNISEYPFPHLHPKIKEHIDQQSSIISIQKTIIDKQEQRIANQVEANVKFIDITTEQREKINELQASLIESRKEPYELMKEHSETETLYKIALETNDKFAKENEFVRKSNVEVATHRMEVLEENEQLKEQVEEARDTAVRVNEAYKNALRTLLKFYGIVGD